MIHTVDADDALCCVPTGQSLFVLLFGQIPHCALFLLQLVRSVQPGVLVHNVLKRAVLELLLIGSCLRVVVPFNNPIWLTISVPYRFSVSVACDTATLLPVSDGVRALQVRSRLTSAQTAQRYLLYSTLNNRMTAFFDLFCDEKWYDILKMLQRRLVKGHTRNPSKIFP